MRSEYEGPEINQLPPVAINAFFHKANNRICDLTDKAKITVRHSKVQRPPG